MGEGKVRLLHASGVRGVRSAPRRFTQPSARPRPPHRYQGEANVADANSSALAAAYACLFPRMISSWRTAFGQPEAYFGFVQLSTWCTSDASNNASIAQMRDAQLAAIVLPGVGYATNADHGFGCDIRARALEPSGGGLTHSPHAPASRTRLPPRPSLRRPARQAVRGGTPRQLSARAALQV